MMSANTVEKRRCHFCSSCAGVAGRNKPATLHWEEFIECLKGGRDFLDWNPGIFGHPRELFLPSIFKVV